MSEKFWIVWLPDRGIPRIRHAERLDAVKEAERVAKLESKRVFVCECVGYAEPQEPPVVWVDVDAESEKGA